MQTNVPRCIIGAHKLKAADLEISSLRANKEIRKGANLFGAKEVLDRSTHEEGEFTANFFLRPKKQEGNF